MSLLELARRPIRPRVWRSWLPRPRHRTWDWIREHVRDKDGRPFDGDSFPWVRGPCDAYDDPSIREIDLQWATRIGKTFIGHAIHLKIFATEPMPTMFASSVENLAKATVRDEIYPMLEYCRPLAGQLQPAPRRSMARIALDECICRVSWGGSESRMAGYGCWFLHANEVDKYSYDETKEGDRLGQLLERVIKQFPDYKVLIESSPSLAGHSRIARRVRQSSNCRFHVPCPRCHGWQQLQLGDNNPKQGGLVWDRTADGGDDVQLAYDTARYVCRICQRDIHDEDRPRMMRQGQWVADGQHIDGEGRVKGEALRPRPAWGSQLSSLYALSLRWGDIARKKVECDARAPDRQIFINGWMGEEFEEGASKTEPEELGEKLEINAEAGTVPAWAKFLTAAVDRQEWGFIWSVYAWGNRESGHLVDRDVCDTWEDVLEILDRRYAVAGGGSWLGIPLSLIDSGFKAKETYNFCKRHSTQPRKILPCKGASSDLGGAPYRKSLIAPDGKKGPKRIRRQVIAARGQILVHVAIDYWEALIQDYFDKRRPGEPGSLSIFKGAGEDLDLCRQLLNGKRSEIVNRRNVAETLWVKRWIEVPNDYRDVLRYSRCAAEIYARGNWNRRAAAMTFRSGTKAPAAAELPSSKSPADQSSANQPAQPPAREHPADRKRGFIDRPQGRWIRRR